MQRYNAMVNIHGERHQMVRKSGLSAAEILVLTKLHGAGAVHTIKTEGGLDKTPHRKEMERLMAKYKRARTDDKPVLSALFNVNNPQLPKDIKELDIPEALWHESDRPKAKPPTAAQKKAAEKKAADDEAQLQKEEAEAAAEGGDGDEDPDLME